MHILFEKVHAPDRQQYLLQKLHAWCRAAGMPQEEITTEFLERVFHRVLEQGDASLPIRSQADLAPEYKILRPDEAKDLEEKKKCALQEADRYAPLIEGEEVRSDFFSVLSKTHDRWPADTVVLRRETNLATYSIVFPHARAIERRVVLFEPPPAGLEAPRAILEGSGVSKLAKTLAGAVLKGAAGKLGALAFDLLVSEIFGDYFDVDYDRIREIVKQEVAANTIAEINGKVSGVSTWLKNSYAVRKKAGAKKKELFDSLLPQEQKIQDVTATLQQGRFAEPGFSVYLVGAPLLLLINQERALVDPDVDDPHKSSYLETIRRNAQDFSGFAQKQWDAIVKKRKAYVGVYADVVCETQCVTDGWYYNDGLTRHKSADYVSEKNGPTGREKAAKAAEDYKSRVVGELSTSLSDPQSLINDWKALTKHPLPA